MGIKLAYDEIPCCRLFSPEISYLTCSDFYMLRRLIIGRIIIISLLLLLRAKKPHEGRCDAITAMTEARLWVLDRQVFQAIMMTTGIRRQEETMKFLRRWSPLYRT